MNTNDLEVNAYFTTNGKDIWKLASYFSEPSCRLVNMDDTAIIEEFGISSRNAQRFHRIQMPKEIKEEAETRAKIAQQQPIKLPNIL